MLKLDVTNENGEILHLTHNEQCFKVTNIDGLQPPKRTIYSSNVYTIPGEVYNYSKDEKRNIVINMYLVNNVSLDKYYLVKFFRSTEKITLIFDDVYKIDGYVETLNYNQFDNVVACQISIMCLYPYFYSWHQKEYYYVGLQNLFYFPFSLDSYGEPLGELLTNESVEAVINRGIDTGCYIEMIFNNNGENLELINTENGSSILINRTFEQGDQLIVDLTGINKVFTLNGRNIISNVVPSTNLLYLSNGSNNITYNVQRGLNYNDITLKFTERFLFINELLEDVI